LVNSNIVYTPDANYVGSSSFNYTVTDDGTTNGQADPRSSSGVVNVDVLSTRSLTYLLKVDGVKGDSTLKGYEGAFTVDEFTFNELTKSSTSAGGGGGAGKAQFDPLTVDIGKLSPGLAALLGDAATGKHIPTIELVGLKQGESLQKVYDLTLSNATVAGYANDGGHDTAIAFNFLKGSETIKGQNPDGSLNAGQTVNFTATSLAPVDHDTLAAFAHVHTDFFLV